MTQETPLPSPKIKTGTDAWKLLLERNADVTPYASFDRQSVNYTIRSNDWKLQSLDLDQGVLEQGDFSIPYAIKGAYGRIRPRRETLLAIDLPGGPGSVLTTQWRSNISPEQYRVATANWRGVGDTAPFADITNNRTERLLDDIDALRIAGSQGRDEPVVIRGGSWGMTMALMYAAARPDKVAGLVLGLPFLATAQDVKHNYAPDGALAQKYPEGYANFRAAMGTDCPLAGLAKLADEMGHADERRVKKAFIAATAWEYARNGERYGMTEDTLDLSQPENKQLVARARVLSHYAANRFFLPEEGAAAAFRNVRRDLPIIMMAHKADPLCAPGTLGTLQAGLPQAEMHVYDANWHWVARENENRATGFDNSFVSQGYPFAMGRLGLAAEGRLRLTPGVQTYARPR